MRKIGEISPLLITEGLPLLPIRYLGGLTASGSAGQVSIVIQTGSKHRFSEACFAIIQR